MNASCCAIMAQLCTNSQAQCCLPAHDGASFVVNLSIMMLMIQRDSLSGLAFINNVNSGLPAHASPALTDSCSSSFSRAMTRCLPSTGRGLSKTLVFGVSQTSFDVLRGLRDPERLSFEGSTVYRVVYGSGTVRWSVGCSVAGAIEVSVDLRSL